MVVAFAGAGTSGRFVFGSPGIWMSGIGMFGKFVRSGSEGNDGAVRVGDDVSGGPGSVVIATEPSVVC